MRGGTAADGAGPAAATEEGAALHASLTAAVAPATRELYAGLDPADLAIARRVLVQVTERAGQFLTGPELATRARGGSA